MDVETRDIKGLAPLEPELERIRSIADHDQLAVYFAGALKRGFDMPFNLGQYADMKYRANGAVRNVPEFYEAFDVVEGDALYLPPEERVKIW